MHVTIIFLSSFLGIGAVPSPFDCYLANRGLRTLHVRMRAHAENALAVAKYLESSQFVDSVSYPGMNSIQRSFFLFFRYFPLLSSSYLSTKGYLLIPSMN